MSEQSRAVTYRGMRGEPVLEGGALLLWVWQLWDRRGSSLPPRRLLALLFGKARRSTEYSCRIVLYPR
jgi:hypothetical protein